MFANLKRWDSKVGALRSDKHLQFRHLICEFVRSLLREPPNLSMLKGDFEYMSVFTIIDTGAVRGMIRGFEVEKLDPK
jgi:hypothetical protein